jgi:hypothetical protein
LFDFFGGAAAALVVEIEGADVPDDGNEGGVGGEGVDAGGHLLGGGLGEHGVEGGALFALRGGGGNWR